MCINLQLHPSGNFTILCVNDKRHLLKQLLSFKKGKKKERKKEKAPHNRTLKQPKEHKGPKKGTFGEWSSKKIYKEKKKHKKISWQRRE